MRMKAVVRVGLNAATYRPVLELTDSLRRPARSRPGGACLRRARVLRTLSAHGRGIAILTRPARAARGGWQFPRRRLNRERQPRPGFPPARRHCLPAPRPTWGHPSRPIHRAWRGSAALAPAPEPPPGANGTPHPAPRRGVAGPAALRTAPSLLRQLRRWTPEHGEARPDRQFVAWSRRGPLPGDVQGMSAAPALRARDRGFRTACQRTRGPTPDSASARVAAGIPDRRHWEPTRRARPGTSARAPGRAGACSQ